VGRRLASRRTLALAIVVCFVQAGGPRVVGQAQRQGRVIALRGATVMTVARGIIPNGTVLLRDGNIAAVGANVDVPAGAEVVDVCGRFVTPGLIIYSLNFPTRPRTLAPDDDEPIRELRARAHAPKVPAALEKAGLTFAFSSSGLRESRDFIRNAGKAVKEGLSADAAVRALTIDAACIASAGDRLGSLEKGKIANVIVTDGDLFEEKTRVRHVFVDGREINVPDEPEGARSGGGRGGNWALSAGGF
jgi:imidazolonepropionase-like amidohydrolase